MFELTCLDLDGNQISHFTQWDSGQQIIILGSYSSAPIVHFCNKNSDYALCVQSELLNSEQIKVDVPNSLLIEPHPIILYVYLTNGDNKRTILSGKIPVRPRIEPEGRYYEENIHVVYLSELEQQVIELNRLITEAEDIRVSNENSRVAAEETRKKDETTRQNNESSRANAETKRGEDFDNLLSSMNDAIKNCNTSTTTAVNKCDTATNNANIAANNANTAANEADAATKSANEAVTIINNIISDSGNIDITFSEASTRTNIESGETLSILFGKIKKWFTDIEAMNADEVTQSDINSIVT